MNWILLSLLAPVFFASSNFIDKYILGKYTKGIFDFVFFSTISCWFFFAVLLSLMGLPELNAYSLIPILTGVILIYSYAFYGKALEQGDTSTLVVLFKLIPVLTVVLAYVFLGQTLSSNELFGFIIVLIGAVVVSLEKSRGVFFRGFGMILIAIVMWSVITLLVDYGLTKISFWDYLMLDTFGSALAGLPLLLVPSMRKQVVDGLKTAVAGKYIWFVGNNVLDFLGQMTIKKALAIAPSAGLVTVVMQVQSLYSIVIGILLTIFLPNIIGEDISRPTLIKKLVGALVMFSGVYILLI
ncbi:MAG: EamA family transporter [Candidatus Moranbacteria bacterium]|nr:EamA family transporter [Candidatus Moranbacteria bacterium]